MTAKHKPATSLPWDWRTVTREPSNMADLVFAAHAANAYPKLVEALRKVLDDHRRISNVDGTSHCAADALLRSIGESE